MIPVLKSERLLLRPFTLADAGPVAKMAGDYDLYRTTLSLPHPYVEENAVGWIKQHETHLHEHGFYTWAIELKATSELIGCISIGQNLKQHTGELGYWIGKPFWNKGFGTEASKIVMDFGFKALCLNKMLGRFFTINPASGKIMAKCGMHFEGTLKESILKDGTYHDIGYYGLLRSDWLKQDDHKKHIHLDIRKATAHDAAALQTIEQKAFQEDIVRYGDRQDCPANESLESLLYKIHTYDYYTVFENDKCIGGADIRTNPEQTKCRMARIYLDPRYHDLGIGRRVMLELESYYPDATHWSLDTPYLNLRNHHFYESLGYVKQYTKKIDDILQLFEYEKHLKS